MAKPSTIAAGTLQRVHLLKLSARYFADYHLCQPVSPLNQERLVPVIDNDKADLSPVIGVDRSGSVKEGDSVLQRETTSGADLSLVSRRDGNRNPRGDKPSFPRVDNGIL